MFNCFIRFLTYSHTCSPACCSTQSGPTQINKCRLSLPTPNCSAIVGGGSFCGLAMSRSYTEQNCFFSVKNQLSDRGLCLLFDSWVCCFPATCALICCRWARPLVDRSKWISSNAKLRLGKGSPDALSAHTAAATRSLFTTIRNQKRRSARRQRRFPSRLARPHLRRSLWHPNRR